jgi:hypothetical protein
MKGKVHRPTIFLLLALALLFLAGYGVKKMGDPGVEVYNVTHYGAVADATEATGCDEGESSPFDCDGDPGTGTDNSAAISAAVAAAVAAGGGTVYIPAGSYRLSAAGGDFREDAITIQGSNVTIQGDGPGATVLLPGDDNGMIMILACSNPTADCVGATQIENIVIRDLTLRDDDPWAHWCADAQVVEATTIGGAYLFDEPLTIEDAGAGATANFFWQAATADSNVIIYTNVVGTPVVGDVIKGDKSTTVGSTIASITHIGGSAEESHGISLHNVRGFLVENVRFEYLGDEALEIRRASTAGKITKNVFYEVPGCPSSGSAVALLGGNNISITDNDFIMGVSGGDGLNAGVDIAPITAEGNTTDIIISNNRFIESDNGNNDHSEAQFAIAGNTDNGTIDRIVVENNLIQMEIDKVGACDGDTSWCDEDADCGGGGAGIICTGMNRSCETANQRCSSIQFDDNDAQDRLIELSIQGNILDPGNMWLDLQAADSALQVLDNMITGDHEYGIEFFGTSARVAGNEISGHGLGCVRTMGGDSDMTLRFHDNTCSTGTGEGNGARAIMEIGTNSLTYGEVYNNDIIGVGNVAGDNVYGLDCNDDDVDVIGNRFDNHDSSVIYDCNHRIEYNRITTSVNHYGIFLDTVTGASIVGNDISSTTLEGIHCDDCQYTTVIGNVVETCGAPEIHMVESGDTSDYNLCMGNVNRDSAGGGAEIECGDGASAGDDVGCADDGAAAANTYCGGNIQAP